MPSSDPTTQTTTRNRKKRDVFRSLCVEKTPEGGIVRLMEWPEGYVLWYHGEIVWKSWTHAKPKE